VPEQQDGKEGGEDEEDEDVEERGAIHEAGKTGGS
jgi:hypothetical protein